MLPYRKFCLCASTIFNVLHFKVRWMKYFFFEIQRGCRCSTVKILIKAQTKSLLFYILKWDEKKLLCFKIESGRTHLMCDGWNLLFFKIKSDRACLIKTIFAFTPIASKSFTVLLCKVRWRKPIVLQNQNWSRMLNYKNVCLYSHRKQKLHCFTF